MKINIEEALESKAWPFQEADKLLKKIGNKTPEKGYVLFETGYGPSGLPHIGTFAEVFRTTLVKRAFEKISDIPTKLFAFSDDMDGLRKVPDNIPNQDMVKKHLGKPLTSIPDPFGTHESFGHHMNSRLKEFLDHYEFEYEFKSATDCYNGGVFDKALLRMLEEYDKVMKVILPTLGEERQKTYSPFLPVSPRTGKVLQVPVIPNTKDGTISFKDEDGTKIEVPVTGGNCKLQWKPDWGMRWAALGVDYEMHGKDLTPSAKLSSQICKIIGGRPPLNFVYEMFLDEAGEKISKSKGNGIAIEDWLKYGTPESLSTFLFANPKKARKLHFAVIPKSVDEYITHLSKFPAQEGKTKYTNPVWHIHDGEIPEHKIPISFGLLLNLASACNPESPDVLWGFISRYAPDTNPDNNPLLDTLVKYAMAYYEDFVKPDKYYREPTHNEKEALLDLKSRLEKLPSHPDTEEIQTLIFSVGKDFEYSNLREWFKVLYEVLLGQEQGPRMGSFIALYGVKETCELIDKALEGKMAAA